MIEVAASVTGMFKQDYYISKPVSYTHLDVYKRQLPACAGSAWLPW